MLDDRLSLPTLGSASHMQDGDQLTLDLDPLGLLRAYAREVTASGHGEGGSPARTAFPAAGHLPPRLHRRN